MYLSRLELLGFKSFAQKTLVDFNSGVTCVVGPNGCGKTNILDAIRWVLGEQKSSTLRSDKMENVIFNGSRHRKPMGMAEVSLTIENSRSILPVEYSEITLTRRLYRSGESEYLMNRMPCRLKDITDLFMDTGMGANSYSVIELKMVEELLSEKPDERRHLFEEAAGITKYKHRRRAALRKLDETRQDMLRLEDIVSEAERSVNSLKRQMKRTERYRALTGELRDKDLLLARAEFNQLSLRREPLLESVAETRKSLREADRDLAEAGSRDTELDKRVLESETARDTAEEALQKRMAAIRLAEQEQLVGGERRRSLEESLERIHGQQESLGRELQESRGLREELAERLEAARSGGGDLIQLQQDAELRSRESAERLLELRRQGDSARAGILSNMEELSRRQSELARVSANVDSLQQRVEDIEEEERLARLDSGMRGERREELSGALNQAVSGRVAREAALEEARVELASAERVLRENEKDCDALRNELRGAKSRRGFLEGILQRFEGLPGGAKAVLQADLPGVIDTLGNQVHAGEGVIRALEAAMGPTASHVVVRDRAALEEAAGWLEKNGGGACTFLVLDGCQDPGLADPPAAGLRSLAGEIRCAPEYTALLRTLLREAWLCDNLEELDTAALPAGTLVLDGEGRWFLAPRTWHRGRESEKDQSHLGLGVQLDQLAEEIAELEKRLAEGEEAIAVSRGKLEAARGGVSQTEADLNEHGRRLRELESSISQLDFAEESYRRDQEISARSREELRERTRGEADRERALKEQIEELLDKKDADEGEANAIFRRLEEAEEENRKRSETAASARLQATEHKLRVENLEQELASRERFLEEGGSRLERLGEEEAAARGEAEELRRRGEELESELVLLGEARSRDQQELDQRREELRELVRQQKEKHRQQDELHKTKESLTAGLHKAELELSEIDLRLQALQERALQELEAELGRAEDEQELARLLDLDAERTRREIEELREQIRRLGPVNLLAIEEYDTEKSRLDFLQKQLGDLLEAEAMLKETITRINRVATELFTEAFSKIQGNFDYLFKKLFKTGKATIELDGSDPLEAKINISATPSGKRIQALTLMSGGEKTLTAIALLFAIYMVKPSPFCILDEVDAPLDDHNIGRFNSIIQEFAQMTQFIIITHNKKTMGYGQSLYGVTMAEPGVSSLVAVQFGEAGQLAQA